MNTLAQIMPVPDGASAVLGCVILLMLVATLAAAIVATVQNLLARKRQQPRRTTAGRIIGAVAFLIGIGLIAFESHASYVQPKWRLVALASLVVFGLTAWMAGAFAASRREKVAVTVVSVVAIAATGALIGYDADYRTRRDRLISAAARGDAAEVRAMLASGIDPNLRDDIGRPVIEKAMHASTAAVLLDAGASRQAAWATLAEAARLGNVELVSLLLEKGVHPISEYGSASRIAWTSGHAGVLEALRRGGAPDAERMQRRTGMLIAAVHADDLRGVQEALAGDYLDGERIEGLRVAASRGNRDITLALVGVTASNPDIAVAAVAAAKHGHTALFGEVLGVLEQRKAGFIIRETKAAALAEAPDKSEELLRLTATPEWEALPSVDTFGVKSLRERASAQ